MESKKNSRVTSTTIDNIVSELKQLERRTGEKPVVNVKGKYSDVIQPELESRGYVCSEDGTYTLGVNKEDLRTYDAPTTTHFPQKPTLTPQGF